MVRSTPTRPPGGSSCAVAWAVWRPAVAAARRGPGRASRRPWWLIAPFGVVLGMLGPLATGATAADLPTIEAHALLSDNARIGSWMATRSTSSTTGRP